MSEFRVDQIRLRPISNVDAKAIVKKNHYMKTFPAGALISFGVFLGESKLVKGVLTFGKSQGTDSKLKFFPGLLPENIIEMQRMWISDDLGHNSESKTLSLVMEIFKKQAPKIKVVWTYAGGCKDDCGIVYQSSGFMYLGCEQCKDFYLTDTGDYKNVINIMKFGKGDKSLPIAARAAQIFGPGKILETHRYYYFYPLDKGVRRRMQKATKPFPKESAMFRKDQKWVTV